MSGASGRAGFLWLLLLAAFVPVHVRAQPRPADVADVAPDVELPGAPDDYSARQVGEVRWEYPAQASSVAGTLQGVFLREWDRVVSELGVDEISSEMTIRIGRNPDEMASLAPPRAAPPRYASGVAYPSRGLVLMTLSDPETSERPDVEAILVHELSHVALHRAVLGNRTPRWFDEGVAIYQARERSFERTRVLWGGTVGDRLMSFEQLSDGFPNRPHGVSLAYAQSADFVSWLRARPNGQQKFRAVIQRLRDGQSFQTALERTYSASMTRLEIDWHDSLAERFKALPLLLGSGTVWVLAALLILVAYARRRRKDRAKFREWAQEESATATGALLVVDPGTDAAGAGPSPSAPAEDSDVLYVVPAEPRVRDSGIPTVEHEGRSHTLH